MLTFICPDGLFLFDAQSCKNIHLLESFDGKNRSCRSSLAKARLKSKQRKHEEYHAIAAYQQQASVQPPLEQAAGALGGGFEQAGHQINQAYLAAQQPQQHDQNASPWLNVHNVQPTAQMPFVQEYELPGNASHSDDLLVPPTAPSSHNMGQMRAGLASAVQPLSEEGYEIAQLLHEQIGAASSETEINEAEQIVCPLLHEGQREQQQQQDGNGLGLELHSICAKLFSSTPDQLSPNIRDAIIGWLQRFPTSVASFLRPSCTQLLCDMCVASDAWMGELPLNSELERFDRLRMDGQDVKEQLALKDIEPAVCVLDEDMLSIKCQTTHDTLERYMEIRCADDGNAYGIPLRPMHFEGKCATCVAETQPKYTGLPRWAGCVMQALEFSHSERNELRSEVWPLVIVPDPKVQREVAAATFALQKLVQKDRRKLGAFLVLLGRAFAGVTVQISIELDSMYNQVKFFLKLSFLFSLSCRQLFERSYRAVGEHL